MVKDELRRRRFDRRVAEAKREDRERAAIPLAGPSWSGGVPRDELG
jgi:hypothetical protein